MGYARDMGFTHLELMPVSEFPFDGSWGYQPVGLYAPTIRFGPPHEFRDLVQAAHGAGLGVILDWVPGHFPTDTHGLGRFDGTPLYEHADPREGFHRDWNTLIYNYGRREVANFLVANALYWLDEYHVDGLRVDAVASMLYRDYSRPEGEWVPNVHGGRENLEAIAFMERMNTLVYGDHDGIMTVAEESTSYPAVSGPVHTGGLGFGYKWNMGWMNDTLDYIARPPEYRKYHHHQVTNTISWAFSENFVLPVSHDEVVHGKGSMLKKMPGDEWQKFANLRAYYGYMWGHPGKKLLFMGCEFGQPEEWNHDRELDWEAAALPPSCGRAGPRAGSQRALSRDARAPCEGLRGRGLCLGRSRRRGAVGAELPALRPVGGYAPVVLVVMATFTYPVPRDGPDRLGVPRGVALVAKGLQTRTPLRLRCASGYGASSGGSRNAGGRCPVPWPWPLRLRRSRCSAACRWCMVQSSGLKPTLREERPNGSYNRRLDTSYRLHGLRCLRGDAAPG